jgi:N-acetylglucosamine-6-phosphate deacetylase
MMAAIRLYQSLETAVAALAGARIVTPDGVLTGGWLRVEEGRICQLGSGWAPVPALDLEGGYLVPGFIDLHVHGGGGHDFTASPTDLAAGVAYHRSRGTTRTLVSLMTASQDALCEQLGWVAELARDGDLQVAGAHLEGPFLAPGRCGAQNGAHLQPPDRQMMSKLIAAGQGFLRTVTVAPELPGALEVIADLVVAGVVAAIGHTDASYQQAAAGYAAGATLTTHLFNAMSPLGHREPGAAVAALDSGSALEIINDGVHVHEAMISLAARAAGNLVLVTDAISAAGAGDGAYVLGGLPVTVRDGKARTATGGLAGSTLTMDVAFRRAVREVGLSVEQAAAASATTPARVLGLARECGSIAVGLAADLVHLDEQFQVRRVMVAGRWLDSLSGDSVVPHPDLPPRVK